VAHYTAVTAIVKGRTHRFRYRAANVVGWGPFSAIASILAAGPPSSPPAPTFASYVGGVLTVNVEPSTDNGGAAIT
jgi:hypothetical protein